MQQIDDKNKAEEAKNSYFTWLGTWVKKMRRIFHCLCVILNKKHVYKF